jgi:hypothetical protein
MNFLSEIVTLATGDQLIGYYSNRDKQGFSKQQPRRVSELDSGHILKVELTVLDDGLKGVCLENLCQVVDNGCNAISDGGT